MLEPNAHVRSFPAERSDILSALEHLRPTLPLLSIQNRRSVTRWWMGGLLTAALVTGGVAEWMRRSVVQQRQIAAQQEEELRALLRPRHEQDPHVLLEQSTLFLADMRRSPLEKSDAWMQRAYANAFFFQEGRALQEFESAKRVAPQDYGRSWYAPRVGMIFAESGRYHDALYIFDDLTQHFPEEYEVRAVAGKFFWRTRKTDRRNPQRAFVLLERNIQGQAIASDYHEYAGALNALQRYEASQQACIKADELLRVEVEQRQRQLFSAIHCCQQSRDIRLERLFQQAIQEAQADAVRITQELNLLQDCNMRRVQFPPSPNF